MAATAAEEIVMLNPVENADEQFRYLWNRCAAIQLRALMNRIYYQERQRIFESREGIIKIIAILGRSVAFSKISTAEIALRSVVRQLDNTRCPGGTVIVHRSWFTDQLGSSSFSSAGSSWAMKIAVTDH